MRAALMSFVVLYSLILSAIVFNGCHMGGEIPTATQTGIVGHDDAGVDTMRFVDAAVPNDRSVPIADEEIETPDAAVDVSLDVQHIPARAIAVDPSTCDDETVVLPPDFIRPGETLWHLCYTTPSSQDSASPLALRESESVTFTQRSSWNGAAHDMIRIRTNDSNVRWTASVVVSVPNAPASHALFNARNAYGSETLWAIGADETGHTLATHGVLAVAYVRRDGHRDPIPIQQIITGCLDELMPEVLNGASFLPYGQRCPEEYYLCGPGPFHCVSESW